MSIDRVEFVSPSDCCVEYSRSVAPSTHFVVELCCGRGASSCGERGVCFSRSSVNYCGRANNLARQT